MRHRHTTIRAAISRSLVLLAVFACGWGTARYLPPERFGFGRRADRECAVIVEAWRLIDKHYVDHGAVQPSRLKQAALSAMLTSLGDRGHTSYVTAEQFEQMQKAMRGHTDPGNGGGRPTVSWARVPGQPIAYLAIRDFTSVAHEELQRALQEIRSSGIHGLILDLRGCPGGWREQGIALASEFLSDGNVLLERDAAGRQTEVPVRPNGHAQDLPLCVLVDADTASCAEILAGALQDHGRAPLIGTQTFGAGTLLQPFPLSDGSAVLLAVAEWRTPNGRKVWHKGLTPDIQVSLPPGARRLTTDVVAEQDTETLAQSEDTQFLTALEELQEKLGCTGSK